MAFPSVVTVATNSNKSGSSVAMTMPASLAAGNLLLMVVFMNTSAGHNVSGWTLTAGSPSGTGNSAIALWIKQAVGSDTATVTINDNSSRLMGSIITQVSGWSGNLADVTATAANQGVTTTPIDPPNHVPLMSADYLWLATGAGGSAPTVTAPTGYSNLSTALANSSAWTVAQARRTLTADAEDPGAFGGNMGNPIGMTVAIPSAGFPGPPPRRLLRPLLPR